MQVRLQSIPGEGLSLRAQIQAIADKLDSMTIQSPKDVVIMTCLTEKLMELRSQLTNSTKSALAA